MRVLVTGGAGYIGIITAGRLLEPGHAVTVFDSLVRGHRAAVPEGARFFQGDLGDRTALDSLMSAGRFEAIVHFAALAEAHLLGLDALTRHEGLICNLGNGAGYSVRQVIETSRRVTGRPIPAREDARRPGDAAILVADAQRARDVLGWQPRIPDLDDVIASAWDWHRGHANGYDD